MLYVLRAAGCIVSLPAFREDVVGAFCQKSISLLFLRGFATFLKLPGRWHANAMQHIFEQVDAMLNNDLDAARQGVFYESDEEHRLMHYNTI